jgi:hypothetical protein
MKKKTTLLLLLLFAGTTIATSSRQNASSNASAFDSFWQSFKTAVSKRDVETIARLSKFPLEMSYGIPAVKNQAQLSRRYRQVFSEQTNAAECFKKARPEVNAENPKQYSVACPDAAGNEVVLYHFAQTRSGWKFTGLDNINE